MKEPSRQLAIGYRALSLVCAGILISGCGPGQFLGPTVTPTSTNTPLPTATATATATPIPTPLGGGWQIAFATNRDGNWEIYKMVSDGSKPTRLTTAPLTNDEFPIFAPDHETILYSSYSGNPIAYGGERWLTPDGTTGVLLNNIPPYMSFSPDGKLLAFSDFSAANNLDIYIGSLSEKVSPRRLTTYPGPDDQVAWSPGGGTIVFVSHRDGTSHLYTMTSGGGYQRRLTNNDMYEGQPAWSPDGAHLAFVGGKDGGQSDIYIVNADGTGTRNLTNQAAGQNRYPAWSPDGLMVAFSSNRTGNREIFAMRLDGSGLINLTNNPAEDDFPAWSR